MPDAAVACCPQSANERALAPAELVYVPWLHEMQEMDAAKTGVLVMRDGMLGTQVR